MTRAQIRPLLVLLSTFLLSLQIVRAQTEQWRHIGATGSSPMGPILFHPSGVIFAGVAGGGGGMFISTNDGLTWQEQAQPGPDLNQVRALVATPAGTILWGTYNDTTGIHRSTDLGVTWTPSSTGLTTNEIMSLAVSPTGAILAGGLSNGAFRSTDDGVTWTPVLGQADWVTSISFAPDSVAYLCTYNSKGVYRSTDDGLSWTQINSSYADTSTSWPADLLTPGNGVVYVATHGEGIFKTTNDGSTWSVLMNGPEHHVSLNRFYVLIRDSLGTLYAGTNEAGAFMSTNDGGSWTPINNGLSSNVVNSLVFEPGGHLYAGTETRLPNGGLFKSTFTALPLLRPVQTIVAFGTVAPGAAGAANVTLVNSSLKAIEVTGWALTSSGSAFAPEAWTPVSIAGGDTLRISVAFEPASAGQYVDTLVIASDAVNAPLRVVLQGTGAVVPPSAPELLTPADQADSVLLPVQFRWHAAAGAASYTLEVAPDQTFTNIVTSRSSLTDTTVSIDVLAFSMTYAWRVTAVNAAGEALSAESFTFRTAPAPPAPPMLISPVDDSTNVFQPVTFRWQHVAGADGYRLLIAPDSMFLTSVVDTPLTVIDSAMIQGLAGITRYFWTVIAENISGWSDTLEVWSFVTSPDPPTDLAPFGNEIVSSLSPTLSWAPVEGALSYEVQVAQGPWLSPIVVWKTDITTTTLTIGPLFGSTQYWWRVRAVGPFGAGPWHSNWLADFRTPAVTATGVQAVSVRADWDSKLQGRMIGVFDSRLVFLATDSTFLYDGTAWTSYPPVYNGGPRRPVQYGEDLYTGMYEGASVWKFRYGSWTSAFSPPEQRAGSRHSMAVSQGSLWYGTHWNGKLYRWNGSSYTVFSTGSMEVCPVIEYDSTAYAFTNETGEGKMFRYNAATGNLDEVMILSPFYHTLDAVVYDGKLYMSNYLNPHGVVEVYDGTSKTQVWDRGDNTWPMYYAVSGDSLFVTVWNETESKSEIWLSTNGSTFAQIYSHPLTGGANQIGSIQAYQGDLFFSTPQYTYRINLDAESLTESSIRLLAPNGGESVHAGDSVEVRFIASYPGQVIAEWTTSGGHPWNVFDTVEVAGDTISCWLVPSSTSLWWKVRVSYAGNRELKDESDSVFVVAPLPPRLLAPADGSDNQPLSVTLEWEYVEGTNGVGIQLALDSLFTQVVLRDTIYEAPLTSYAVSELQRDTQYYWSVWACLGNAHGRPATPRTFKTMGIVETSSPEIVFDDIAVGDSATAMLAIRNVSRYASRRLQIGLASASSRFSISPSGEIDCPPGDSVMVTIMFRPTMYGRANDSLIITSLSDVVTVPIAGVSNSPEISVVTPLLVFDQVRRGDSAIALFRLTSTSVNPFFLDTVRTNTSAFKVSYMKGPIIKGDTLDAQVVFYADAYGIHSDTLMGVLGEFEGPLALLFGRSPWPFLAAEPPSGRFKETPVGSRDTIELILRDTTVNRATVDSITFALSVFSATYVPGAGGADSSLCRIVFAPTAAGAYEDTMFIWADLERGCVAIPLSGSGTSVSAVALEDLSIPKEFVVTQNYPNPFNPSTTIRFGLPEESSVRAVVVDMAGRQVAVLTEGVRKAGWHQSVWRASVASGVYFLRVEATPVVRPLDVKVQTLKMLLLR